MIALMEHSQNLDVFSLPLVAAFTIDFWLIPTVTRERFWQVSLEAADPIPLSAEHPFCPEPSLGPACFPPCRDQQGEHSMSSARPTRKVTAASPSRPGLDTENEEIPFATAKRAGRNLAHFTLSLLEEIRLI